MRVDITSTDEFAAIAPDRIDGYLRSNGWSLAKELENRVQIWETNKDGKRGRVWLPTDTKLTDYAMSIKRLVGDLAAFKNKSQLEVFDDLTTIAQGDVIRLTGYDPYNLESTSLPLAEGIALIEKARRMTAAAALSTDSRRPAYSPHRPPSVAEYLDTVRLGQTERGSYKIKLISPLPAQGELLPAQEPPFQRKVVNTLMASLNALREVSFQSLRKGRYDFGEFLETVDEGVSANLCEALTHNLISRAQTPVDVSVTFSGTINAATSTIDQVEFDSSILFFVEQAGRDLRESHPEEVMLRGQVRTLSKHKSRNKPPKISLVCAYDDRLRTVHISLADDEMHLVAIEAYREEREIIVTGVLRHEGFTLTMDNPVRVSMV